MDADKAPPFPDKIKQTLPQFKIVKQDTRRVIEANRIELLESCRSEHLDILADCRLIGPGPEAHAFNGIVSIGN